MKDLSWAKTSRTLGAVLQAATRALRPRGAARNLARVAALAWLGGLAGTATLAADWQDFRNGVEETVGLLGLQDYAEVNVWDGRGRRKVTLQYKRGKMGFSSSLDVQPGGEVPGRYRARDWRVYQGQGLVFLAEQGGAVRHVLQGGSRVPFLRFFRDRLEGEQTLMGASGERTVTLEIDPEVIARLERRSGQRVSTSSGVAAEVHEVVVQVISGVDADEVTRLDELRRFDVLGGYGNLRTEVHTLEGSTASSPRYLVRNPRIDPETWERNADDDVLQTVEVQEYTGDEVMRGYFQLKVGDRTLRTLLVRYDFGPFVVYSSYGPPSEGFGFEAIQLDSLAEDQQAPLRGVLDTVAGWADGLFGQ